MLIGGIENQTVQKHVVVLGGESRLKTKRQMENDSSNKKPRPLYNHCMIYMCATYILLWRMGLKFVIDITIYIFFAQMQMVAAGGTTTGKVLIMRNWGSVKYGRGWDPPHLEAQQIGIDLILYVRVFCTVAQLSFEINMFINSFIPGRRVCHSKCVVQPANLWILAMIKLQDSRELLEEIIATPKYLHSLRDSHSQKSTLCLWTTSLKLIDCLEQRLKYVFGACNIYCFLFVFLIFLFSFCNIFCLVFVVRIILLIAEMANRTLSQHCHISINRLAYQMSCGVICQIFLHGKF